MYIDQLPKNGSIITINNLEQMPMPVVLEIRESNGKTGRVELPVEIWQKGSEWKFRYKSTSPIVSVVLDPDGKLPDVNGQNNSWYPKSYDLPDAN
jgi:hypothetical protein